ncbi:MAG TPA: tRNA (N(6)-L-threonylcarbamoyladenosine(37)-C(2))-methylthiotransferase MtaB [Candidatus Eisenbacteria bacterium]|nr:tRNA (N(6)-L-threonylcarbamoyladenosine(37)-C(2))-methylthiotransferase MtaB [Candidatus Eisenbacteria bacterium]
MPRFDRNPPEERPGAPRVSFFTLGCRLNQHDTAAMRSDLARAGWSAPERGAAAEADVAVVNTCTVTRRADQESRQLIRKIAREAPGVRIVVTGCYAQRAPEELRGLPGVALVLGTAERERIAEWLPAGDAAAAPAAAARAGSAGIAVSPGRARRTALPADAAPLRYRRARALLKIQDGCDSFCAYCIVPYVRGRGRSRPAADVFDQARRLLDAGFLELVLTGADLGSYATEEGGPSALVSLIEGILDLGGAHRVRISSIEPNKVPDGLLELIGTEPRLCRHLHLPLQSGSPAVLRAMRRGYLPGDYARLVERAARRGPVGIGADVIVGHPGEGDAEFEETRAFLRSLPITYLHVFRYSARPGTRAERDSGAATEAVARRRSERLRALGAEKRRRFHESLVGGRLRCVVENRSAATGEPIGTSDVYAPVRVEGALPESPMFDVEIRSCDGEGLAGPPARG